MYWSIVISTPIQFLCSATTAEINKKIEKNMLKLGFSVNSIIYLAVKDYYCFKDWVDFCDQCRGKLILANCKSFNYAHSTTLSGEILFEQR